MVNKADKRSAAAKRKDPARLKPTTVISPSVLKELKYVLDVLATIEVQLKEDREALAQWTPPDATYVFDAVSEGSDIYYEDIYGNPATMSSRVYLKRQENDNPNVPTLFYFGDEARAERAALLDLIPDAAGPESQCSVCGEYRFGGNDADNRRLSHAKSRGDLYDNLLGEVSSLYMLVRRLGPNHPDRDPRHTRLIKDIDGFKQWAAKRRMAVDMLRMKEPSKARFLQAQLRDEIDAERTRLGIPDNVKV